MTIPSLMIYPSIWMQKTFFHYAEDERGARLGHPTARHRDDSDISIRVAAVAHAIFQFAYSNIILVPLIITSVLTAVVTPLSTGFFTREGSVLERIAISFVVAIASLTIPTVSSLYTAVNPDELSDADSFSIQLPIYAHAALLACTLPALPDLVEQLSDRFPAALRPLFGSGDSFLAGIAAASVHWVSGTTIGRGLLERFEYSYYNWRILLPEAIFDQMKENLSNYDRAFNMRSEELSAAVIAAFSKCPALAIEQ